MVSIAVRAGMRTSNAVSVAKVRMGGCGQPGRIPHGASCGARPGRRRRTSLARTLDGVVVASYRTIRSTAFSLMT